MQKLWVFISHIGYIGSEDHFFHYTTQSYNQSQYAMSK
jgi:hypothetical protein